MPEKNDVSEKIEELSKALMFVPDVAKVLRCSDEHVRSLIRRGKLPTSGKIGRRYVLEPADVARFAQRGHKRQLRLAVQWLAELRRDADVDAQRHRVATLLMTTFFLDGPDAFELVDRWLADGGGEEGRGSRA